MSITVIVEFQAKPGKRAELLRVLQDLIEKHGAGLPGYLGSVRYEAIDNPDVLVEIAEWESVEKRKAHIDKAMATGVFAPLTELMGAPFRATVIRQVY
ncbi:MAG: antibiotic biosynthesis monooxygenase family protein [Myxococcota bacterium]|nr:antibiotic biosynthesis monooxygenase family protein [Myxococcota bacterium]